MSEQVTIKVRVKINKVGSTCENSHDMAKSDWEAMSEDAQEGMTQEMMWELIEWNSEVVPR